MGAQRQEPSSCSFCWGCLRGTHERLEADRRGVIASEVFSGPSLAVAKMLAGDAAAVLTELTGQGDGPAGG